MALITDTRLNPAVKKRTIWFEIVDEQVVSTARLADV